MTKKSPPKNADMDKEIKALKANPLFWTFFRRAPKAELAIEKLVKVGFPADHIDALVGSAWAIGMDYAGRQSTKATRREAPYPAREAQRFAKRTREFAADLDRMNTNFVWRVYRPPGFGHELAAMLRLPRELIEYASRLNRVREFHLRQPKSRPDNTDLNVVGFCFWVRNRTHGLHWDSFPWAAVASLLQNAAAAGSPEEPEYSARSNQLRAELSPGALRKRIKRLLKKYPPRRSPPPIT